MCPEERRGVNVESFANVEMRGFNSFFDDLDLVDLPLLGRHFTWYHANGIAMSRIDRCWVSLEWLQMWGDCSAWVCPRDVSDHCPLVLKYVDDNWGPKPFRFNNYWLDHRNFNKVVEECWHAQEVSGWMAFVLKEKLNALKIRLKEWHKEEYGRVENRIAKIVEDIEELDIRGESSGLNSQEVVLRKDLFIDFWKLQKVREASIFQRLRSKWLRHRDENSKYFHSCVVSRSKRNSIMALKVGDIWLEKPDQIKEAVVNFFEDHFATNNYCRPNLDGVVFPTLSPEENLA
jgi:hypothetical protein